MRQPSLENKDLSGIGGFINKQVTSGAPARPTSALKQSSNFAPKSRVSTPT